jgi:hypothetical protein
MYENYILGLLKKFTTVPVKVNVVTFTAEKGVFDNKSAIVTADFSLVASNVVNGGEYNLVIKKSTANSVVMTLPTNGVISNSSATTFTLTGAVNSVFLINFTYDGVNCIFSLVGSGSGSSSNSEVVQNFVTTTQITPDVDVYTGIKITALASALLVNNFEGTPDEMYGFIIRIKDNGTSRAITWDTDYRALGVTLPTATTVGKTMYIGMIWNATDSKFDVTSVIVEA